MLESEGRESSSDWMVNRDQANVHIDRCGGSFGGILLSTSSINLTSIASIRLYSIPY